jgi:acyl dehydratase
MSNSAAKQEGAGAGSDCPERIEYTRTFTQADVLAFRALSGDTNNIHFDITAARQGPIGGFCLPGMLSATMFSALFGSIFPGNGTLYRDQSLRWRRPMFINREYTASAVLQRRWPSKHAASYVTTIVETETGVAVVEGKAVIIHGDRL